MFRPSIKRSNNNDQDTGRREDLLDVIGDVSPDETPLMTLFGTSTAKGTYHG